MDRFATLNIRFALPALALALGASGVPLASLHAQTSNERAFYSAQLAQPQETARFAAGGVVWACGGTTCVAPRGNARPLRICSELQRKTGPITSFVTNGEPMAAELLERCNG